MLKFPSFKFTLIILFKLVGLDCMSQFDETRVCKIIEEWSETHNNKRLQKFNKLYSKDVIFYGQEISGNQAALKKTALLNAQPDFRQDLIGGMTITTYDSDLIKCDFTKEVYSKGKRQSYPSYLLLKEVNGEYLICGESDLITDKNLHFHLSIGKEISRRIIDSPHSSPTNYTLPIISISVLLIISIFLIWRFRKGKSPSKSIETPIMETAQTEIEQKDSYAKGFEFEKFVVHKFNRKYFTVINWRGDKGSNGIYAQSNAYPDLEMQFKHKDHCDCFAIECKFRQSLTNKNTITIAQDYQLENYRHFEREKKMIVFVVIGLGGTPSSPEEIFLIPLSKIKQSEINYVDLIPFKRIAGSNFFWNVDEGKLK